MSATFSKHVLVSKSFLLHWYLVISLLVCRLQHLTATMTKMMHIHVTRHTSAMRDWVNITEWLLGRCTRWLKSIQLNEEFLHTRQAMFHHEWMTDFVMQKMLTAVLRMREKNTVKTTFWPLIITWLKSKLNIYSILMDPAYCCIVARLRHISYFSMWQFYSKIYFSKMQILFSFTCINL